MNLFAIVRGLLIVVVVALVAGGVLVWRGIIHLPLRTSLAQAAPKKTPRPFVPPPTAPKWEPTDDPDAIDPFVVRLAKVNAMAHKQIVTFAEYQDSDGGQRYFLAVVTSCKDLNKIWPINRGVLQEKVETPLALKDDFSIFSFVEYYSQGQWGVSSCDNTI